MSTETVYVCGALAKNEDCTRNYEFRLLRELHVTLLLQQTPVLIRDCPFHHCQMEWRGIWSS